jgi:hypothetical protein
MAFRALQSRHLSGADYDPGTQSLSIQFVNGAVHRYLNVPQTTADTLFQVSSPGTYFHDKIRGKYREMQIAAGSTKSGGRSRRRF